MENCNLFTIISNYKINKMRIIAGKARGTKLYTLDGLETRPTLDRVKESVFNIIQNDLDDCIFLDLFSGSGAIGLEAASRNAKKVILCECSRKAISIIKKNIEKTHLEKQVEIYECDYKECILNNINEKLDIIYIDPPYKTDYAIKALQLLIKKELLKETTKIIIETDREEEIEKQIDELKDIQITDIRKYGRASILFLEKS